MDCVYVASTMQEATCLLTALLVTDEQLPALFKQHTYSLTHSSEHVIQILHDFDSIVDQDDLNTDNLLQEDCSTRERLLLIPQLQHIRLVETGLGIVVGCITKERYCQS